MLGRRHQIMRWRLSSDNLQFLTTGPAAHNDQPARLPCLKLQLKSSANSSKQRHDCSCTIYFIVEPIVKSPEQSWLSYLTCCEAHIPQPRLQPISTLGNDFAKHHQG